MSLSFSCMCRPGWAMWAISCRQWIYCAGPAEAEGCGLIIYIEDIIEIIASDSNAATGVGSMWLLVFRSIVVFYHSGNVGCSPEGLMCKPYGDYQKKQKVLKGLELMPITLFIREIDPLPLRNEHTTVNRYMNTNWHNFFLTNLLTDTNSRPLSWLPRRLDGGWWRHNKGHRQFCKAKLNFCNWIYNIPKWLK